MWEDVVYLGDFSTYSIVLLLTFCNPVPRDCFYLCTALVLPVLKQRKESCWQFYLCVGQVVEVISTQLDST